MTTKTKATTEATPEATAHAEALRLVEEWDTKLAKARQEAEQGRTGADVVTDPGKAADVARRRAQAAEEVHVCTEGLEAAQGRLQAAARALVARESDDLQPAIDARREALTGRCVDVERILSELTEASGLRWGLEGRNAGDSQRITQDRLWVPWDRARLTDPDLTALYLQQAALRVAADGGDPRTVLPVDQLPASLLPGGVLVHPSIAADADAEAERQAEADAWAAELGRRQAEVDAVCKVLGIDPPEVLGTQGNLDWAAASLPEWRDSMIYRERRGAFPDEFNTIVQHCGPYLGTAALDQWQAQRSPLDAA